MSSERYAADELSEFAKACFISVGVPEEDADWTARILVTADLQGRSSHGLSRLTAYIRAILSGKVNPVPQVSVNRTGWSTAMVDADNALGPVAAKAGMEQAISLAKESGIGAVAVRGANHAGVMGLYTSHMAELGLIGLAFTNAQPAIPPFGGRKAYFGTNPIAMSAGRGDDQITIDLSSSIVARGNIILAAKSGTPIPENWALDADGNPTTDARAALAGAVLPMAGAKGYSLALLVEILCGVLSGAAVGANVGTIYDDNPGAANTGLFFVALNPDFFVGRVEFERRLREMAQEIHDIPLAKGVEQIYLPGERRRMTAKERSQTGIPVSSETVDDLTDLALRLGIPFPQ